MTSAKAVPIWYDTVDFGWKGGDQRVGNRGTTLDGNLSILDHRTAREIRRNIKGMKHSFIGDCVENLRTVWFWLMTGEGARMKNAEVFESLIGYMTTENARLTALRRRNASMASCGT